MAITCILYSFKKQRGVNYLLKRVILYIHIEKGKKLASILPISSFLLSPQPAFPIRCTREAVEAAAEAAAGTQPEAAMAAVDTFTRKGQGRHRRRHTSRRPPLTTRWPHRPLHCTITHLTLIPTTIRTIRITRPC